MNRDEIAEKIAAFHKIYIPFPPQTDFQECCDYLIKLGRATRGQAQRGMRTLAETGSGKTTAAVHFVARFEAQYPRTESYVPIVLIALGLEPDGRLRFQRLTIPKQFARGLLAGRYPEMLALPPKLQMWGGPPDFSRVEAQRYLNCFPRDLTWLLSEGRLLADGGGQLIRRAKVEALGRKLIGPREISWRWRVSPREWEQLAHAHGIVRCLGTFWSRAAVEGHFSKMHPLSQRTGLCVPDQLREAT